MAFFLCILCETGEIIEKVLGVLTHQLRDMRRMMQSHGVSEVTMESTAVYWIPVWRVLEPHFHLKLVNPYFIKQLGILHVTGAGETTVHGAICHYQFLDMIIRNRTTKTLKASPLFLRKLRAQLDFFR